MIYYRSALGLHFYRAITDIRTIHELLGHQDLATTVIYIYVVVFPKIASVLAGFGCYRLNARNRRIKRKTVCRLRPRNVFGAPVCSTGITLLDDPRSATGARWFARSFMQRFDQGDLPLVTKVADIARVWIFEARLTPIAFQLVLLDSVSTYYNRVHRNQIVGHVNLAAIEDSESDLEAVTIGVLTALPEEYAACKRIFDPGENGRQANRRATSGPLECWLCGLPACDNGTHRVAITLLPDMGNNAAAIAANILLQHCPKIKHLVMCGIAGAVPNPKKAENHVRLGDIVVSGSEGVVQYDRGKQCDPKLEEDEDDPFAGFHFRYAPRPPCPVLTAALRRITAEETLMNRETPRPWEQTFEEFLDSGVDVPSWKRPAAQRDVLNDSSDGAGAKTKHPRDSDRRTKRPRVFTGPIGAANIVQADPKRRDALRDRFGIKAVEMETSGIADAGWVASIGYIAIRGTCDYCNSCKGDVWHKYAAGIAASFARTLIEWTPCFCDEKNSAKISGSYVVSSDSDSAIHVRSKGSVGFPSLSDDLPIAEDGNQKTKPIDQKLTTHETASPTPQKVLGRQNSSGSEQLTKQVQHLEALLDLGKYEEAQHPAAQLEEILRLMPREGKPVRAGWILLAKLELRNIQRIKDAGKIPDPGRLKELNKEAASVIDR